MAVKLFVSPVHGSGTISRRRSLQGAVPRPSKALKVLRESAPPGDIGPCEEACIQMRGSRSRSVNKKENGFSNLHWPWLDMLSMYFPKSLSPREVAMLL